MNLTLPDYSDVLHDLLTRAAEGHYVVGIETVEQPELDGHYEVTDFDGNHLTLTPHDLGVTEGPQVVLEPSDIHFMEIY